MKYFNNYIQITRLRIFLATFILILAFQLEACASNNQKTMKDKIEIFAENGYVYDSFTTPAGRDVNIVFIKHGSIVLDIDNYIVYIDPVTMFGNDFSVLPKADMILVTHEHHDHLDPKAIDELKTDSTRILTSRAVADIIHSTPLDVNQTIDDKAANFEVTTFPAYNITPDHLNFHPKSRGDLGFIFNIDGFKVYVAGDTEDISEMENLASDKINVAFLPVNQPYTMTPAQAIHAVNMIKPSIVYPYHYGNTDLTPLIEAFKDSEIEVRVRHLE